MKAPGNRPAHFFLIVHTISHCLKGGVYLSSIGYIQVRAYTSMAQIPLEDVAISVTAQDGTVIAMRLTNRNGTFDVPVEVSVPDLAASQSPNPNITPYTDVNLYARLENYETIEIENLQVFANTLTVQNLLMIPLSELPNSWNKLEIFNTPPQNL